jgi:UDP-N-acetylmuramoyl-L-alanyl-D-glutamate--2,6-diaminopimelate ligase
MDMADPGDVVLIAGKGHEDYQEFENSRRIPFSDPDIVREYNESKGKDQHQ